MVLLQSAQSVFGFAQLDPDTGKLHRRRWPSRFRFRRESPVGHYARLGARDVAMYSDDGRLWVQVDDRRLPVDRDLKAEHEVSGRAEHLRLKRLGETIEITYEGPRRLRIADVTPNAEAEDHDFGLFLYNVISDPARQAVMLEQPGDPRHSQAVMQSMRTAGTP